MTIYCVNGTAFMADVSDSSLRKAERAGEAMLAHAPRAAAARYEPGTRRIVIDLINGCSYAFPVSLVQDLRDADPGDLMTVEVDGLGFNLRLPALDVDLYVPSLVSGIFGTRKWMTQEPARSSGHRGRVKGGRPVKVAGQ